MSCRPNFVVLMCPGNIWTVDKYPLKAPLPSVFLACAADDDKSASFSDTLAARLKVLQTLFHTVLHSASIGPHVRKDVGA
jgi:hypothetical protein